MARTNIGNLLIEQGRIDDMQLKSAVAYQRRWGGRIGQAMVTLGFLSEQVLMSTLSLQLGARVQVERRRPQPSAQRRSLQRHRESDRCGCRSGPAA